jgi:hypothetical protein
MKSECYAEGGEAHDDEEILNHVALEAIHAVDAKDASAFREALHTMILDTLMSLEESDDISDETE